MNILGISCFYHDSAACLMKDGVVVAAIEEEKLNRIKHSSDFPIKAINFCLQAGGITVYDIDYIAVSEKPYLKFQRVIIEHLRSYPFSFKNFFLTMPSWLDNRLTLPLLIKKELGYEKEVLFIDHHLSHAASAFYPSPFDEAAIITSDGVGEWATLTVGQGEKNRIKIRKEQKYPHSLGLLYSAITHYLGFKTNCDEGKIMALADYGQPKYLNDFKKIIHIFEDGSFWIDRKYFSFNEDGGMFTRKFIKVFGFARSEGDELESKHFDIASSLQKITEEIILKIANNLSLQVKTKNLCLAGGTFLNCVANSSILEKTDFKKIFIQPASGDSGGALGATLFAWHNLLGNSDRNQMANAFLGPDFSNQEIKRMLLKREARFRELKTAELVKEVAQKIKEDKIIGWFQGRMEWGPRALGHRSILANPANPKMKDILNEKIKKREWFRPFGVSILQEEMENYFDLKSDSPFMLLVGKVKENKKDAIPSAIHINNTSRIQTITKEDRIFYDLIKNFQKITGLPIIINTSFNGKGEPIVCSPNEAYDCFIKTDLDCLAIGNFLVEK